MGHIEAMNKVIVLTGSIVGCAYLTELFIAWYRQNPYRVVCFRGTVMQISLVPMVGVIG
jgi:molybdopterin-containing oxidoreductase family membrane subunit